MVFFILKGGSGLAIYKRCDRCRRRLPIGTRCKCGNKRYKDEARYGDETIKKFYLSVEWKSKRNKAIATYNHLDIYDLYIHNTIRYGRTVHHIVPVKDDWSRRLDDDNLIYLTDSNHQHIHEQMRKGEKERESMIRLLQSLIHRYKQA